MHARDQRIGRQHHVLARRRTEQRRVVAQPEARGSGQRREIARDEIVFAEAGRHGSGGPDSEAGRPAAGLLAYPRFLSRRERAANLRQLWGTIRRFAFDQSCGSSRAPQIVRRPGIPLKSRQGSRGGAHAIPGRAAGPTGNCQNGIGLMNGWRSIDNPRRATMLNLASLRGRKPVQFRHGRATVNDLIASGVMS